MTSPLTEQQLDEIQTRHDAATRGPWFIHPDWPGRVFAESEFNSHVARVTGSNPEPNEQFIAHAREDVPALLAEVRRLRDELAEEKARRNPLLRCLLIKAARDRDQYVGWSTIADGPTGVWSRETALEYGFPRSRLDRADENGSSDLSCGNGHWDDPGFVADQRGWLRRDRIGDYAVEYLLGDQVAAYALLEPFDDDASV